jgi:hemerythrin
MEWGKDCRHGIIWQDFQHKQLIDGINKLLDSLITGNNDKETFYETIKFVKEFSRNHFNLEELYMKKHAFPGMKNHVREHQFFTNDLNKFISVCIYHESESSYGTLEQT